MAEIRLSGINKIYPDGTHAVHNVDLHIADGEFMIMVGPSGCAKSTILRMIAGLETPTSGIIEVNGRTVNEVAPKDRDIAMVFQSYALYPHMTVRENMEFGLKLRRMPQQEINQRVDEAARILGLEQLLDRLPKAMSGGQRQRVAMGRAIVREPQAFLMDEPLSNLDAKLRVQMRTEIAKLHQRLRTTTVYVTHDQVEAMTLGQRICILRKGVVQQVDTPFQVYQNPANVFVGGFIGSPGMNFMEGQLLGEREASFLKIGEHILPLPESVTKRLNPTEAASGRRVIVGTRPEHISLTASTNPYGIPAHVDLVEAMGSEMYVYLNTPLPMPDLSALSDTQATSAAFVAKLGSGSRAIAGAQVAIELNLSEVHLFDPVTQATLLAPAVAHQDQPFEEQKPQTSHITLATHIETPSDTLSLGAPIVGTIEAENPATMAEVFSMHMEPTNTLDDSLIIASYENQETRQKVSAMRDKKHQGFAARKIGKASNLESRLDSVSPNTSTNTNTSTNASAKFSDDDLDQAQQNLNTHASEGIAPDNTPNALPPADQAHGIAPSITLSAAPMDEQGSFRATLARIRSHEAAAPLNLTARSSTSNLSIPAPRLSSLKVRPLGLDKPKE